ncbi:DUF1194 domain-containing protein [Roseibium alexandrii]
MIRSLFLSTAIALSPPALAQDCVSTELVLLADISSSMTMKEREIQRKGYSAAFRSGDVLDAILGSYCGSIAVQYAEFGNHPHIVADWFLIQTDEDAEAFAQAIETADPIPTPDGGYLTGIARAIRFAGESLRGNGITAERQVIDLSADGGDNITGICSKDHVAAARDELTTPTVENGWSEVIINALPIVGGGQTVGTCGLGLSDYMDKFVRGGAGSFLMEANGVSDLPRIVRNKLVQETM